MDSRPTAARTGPRVQPPARGCNPGGFPFIFDRLWCGGQCAEPLLQVAAYLAAKQGSGALERGHIRRPVFLTDTPPLDLQIIEQIDKAHNGAAEDQIFSETVFAVGAGQDLSCSTEHHPQ